MSAPGEERELVAYFEELLAAQVAGLRESEGQRPSSEPEVEMPAEPPEGAQLVSPATALREVFSGIRLGGSRAVGPSRLSAPSETGCPPSGGRPGDGLRMLFGAATLDRHSAAPSAVAPPAAPATTGVAEIDRYLGAGFPPGLWFVTADVTGDATAFLEAAIWEAATRRRPVLYLALAPTGGVEGVRGRLQAMLGHILGDGREVDSILRRTVLRHVRFVDARELADSLVASPDPVGAFLRDLESAIAEPTARARAAPVVAIDDLGAFLRSLGAPSRLQTARALEGVDAVLRRRRAPGLMSAGPGTVPAHTGSGQVELQRRTAPRVRNETVPIDARVVDYSSEGRPCMVGLVYYRSVGMFTAAG